MENEIITEDKYKSAYKNAMDLASFYRGEMNFYKGKCEAYEKFLNIKGEENEQN